MIKRILNLIKTHKLISVIVLVLVLVLVYFVFIRKDTSQTDSYSVQTIENGNITTTVTGTGQVDSLDTVDLKPKVSGDITYIGVKVGQEVKAGTLIASLDAREAKIALEEAKLALADLTEDPDSTTLAQKNNLVSKAYNDAWDTVSSDINEMSTVLDDLDTLYSGYLGSQNISPLSRIAKDKADTMSDSYYAATQSYKELYKLYKTVLVSKSQDDIEKLINESSQTAKLISKNINDAKIVLDYVISNRDDEDNSTAIEAKDSLLSLESTINSQISNFLSIKNNLLETNQALADLVEGADEIDIKSAELAVESKQADYNNHFIRAPIDGVIASLDASIGDTVSGSIGTLISTQKIASISLNEVDIASVLEGQSVNLSFDALSNVNLTGRVYEISSVGSVSSGVVTYDVKISFEEDNEKVKPGMSANIEIVVASKSDILVVSSSAIKTRNNKSYVEVLNETSGQTESREIEIGITDDSYTEIVSGLSLGDKVIIRNSSSSSSSSQSGLKGSGMGGGFPMGGSAAQIMGH